MRIRATHGLLWALVLLASDGRVVVAQESAVASPASAIERPEIRQVYIPSDAPGEWPAGDWVPVDRDELLELLQHPQQASDPQPAFLEQAVYRARFEDSSLVDGTLEATARLRGTRPRFMPLGTPNLAVTQLRWPDGPAVWGLAADTRSLLRVDADKQTLTGQWSLAGREVFSTVEFDLAVLSAVVSRVEIDLPASHMLTVSSGPVSQVTPGDVPGRKTWTIDLGRRTSCRITVSPVGQTEAAADRALVLSQVANYTFIAEGLRLQSDVTIQSLSGTFDTLELTVPAGMQISSVTIGSDTVLPSVRSEDENASLLSVDVRGVSLSRGTTLRLTGKFPVRPGPSQDLPHVGVRDARWLRIHKHVDVARPLQLQNIATDGTLLLDAAIGPDTGAALEFDGLAVPSRVALSVGTPQPDLSATVLTHVDWSRGDPLLDATLQLTARSGSTYSLVCDVPPGWEVTHVTADADSPVAQWQTRSDADSLSNQLQIELRKALTPQNPVEVVVWARPKSLVLNEIIGVPAVLPVVKGERKSEVLLTPPPGVRLRPAADAAYRTVEVGAFLEKHPVLAEQMAGGPGDATIALEAIDPPDSQMLLVTHEPDAEAQAPSAAATNSDGHGNSSALSTDVANSSARADTPLMMPLTVSTIVAVDRGRLCQNHVTFDLPPLRASRELTIHLPEHAVFLTCEGVPAQLGEGREIVLTLPASAAIHGQDERRAFTITYETPLNQSLIAGQAEIPLPEWEGAATTIGWEIRLPDEYRLRTPTTGSTAQDEAALTWSQRLLGPLGKSAATELFWPLSREDWQSLWTEPTNDTSPAPQQRLLLRSTTGAEPSLRLSFWNVSAARQVGWLVLTFTFLLIAWPFHVKRLVSPDWALKLILLGSVAALIAPEFLAIPWGGFVIGAALGALWPEGWRRPRERHTVRPDSKRTTQMALPLAATAGLVLTSLFIDVSSCRGWQASDANAVVEQERAPAGSTQTEKTRLDVLIPIDAEASRHGSVPQIVYVERSRASALLGGRLTPSPAYLLRSAQYHVANVNDAQPSLLARYDVVLLRPHSETSVTLDLTGVLFADDAACQVDGQTAPLLPRRGRDGVVVIVPPIPAAEGSAGIASASIELTCRPRPSDQETPRLDVGIPPIIDSQLTIDTTDGATPPLAIGRSGNAQHSPSDGLWHVALGPKSFLSIHPEAPGVRTRWAVPIEAASVVEAHPLRLQVESRLTFAVEPRWSHLETPSLTLQLPPHSIVRSVRANGLDRSRTHDAGEGPVELQLTFQAIPDRELAIALSFDVATIMPAGATETTIPALPFLAGANAPGFPVHLLGVSASRGLQLAAGDPEGMMPGTTGIDESRLPDWRGAPASRTVDATYQLTSPRPLKVPLSVIAPDISATIEQTLAVRPSVVDWSAQVDLTTRDAPVAYHRVAVDPRVNVRQVRLIQDDVDRLASWSRTSPDDLILFLTEELSGTQTLHLSGTLGVEDRQDFPLPKLAVPSSMLATPAEVRVRRSPDVSVVLTSEERTLVSANTSSQAADDGLIDVATVNIDDTLPPLRIRGRREDSVLDVDQATIVTDVEGGMVVWSSHIRIAAAGMLPAEIEIRLSGESEGVEVASTVPLREADAQNGERTWILSPTATAVDAIQLTVTGRTPVTAERLPEVRVVQGSLARHVAMIAAGTSVDVASESAQALPPGDVPQWLSESVRAAAASARVFALAEPVVRLTWLANADAAKFLRRCDSAVWQQPDGDWQGVTIADVVARTDSGVAFALPDGMVLRSTVLDGDEVGPAIDGTLTVRLTKREQPQRVILWWTAASAQGSGVPLPQPLDAEGVVPSVVVFGDQQQHYEFGPTADVVGAPALLSKLRVLNAPGSVSSPIVTALRDAGVDPASTTSESDASSRVFGVRLNGRSDVVPVQLIDEQLLRMIRVIVAAGIGLGVWFLIGRWIDRLRRYEKVAPGLLGMIFLAAIIWLTGASFVGFVLLITLTCTWLIALRSDNVGQAPA